MKRARPLVAGSLVLVLIVLFGGQSFMTPTAAGERRIRGSGALHLRSVSQGPQVVAPCSRMARCPAIRPFSWSRLPMG